MKLLSIAISSYNAAAYLHYCVESLVIGGEQVGILIINDGSQDQTQEIAECLASKYPNIVRAIYQENKCHGGAVNRGLVEASGRYFNPNHSYLSQLDVTYKTPDLMSHFLPPHEVSF
ncbi:glycosyltransferase family 2 protein, partial [Streptococcus pneumoniae]